MSLLLVAQYSPSLLHFQTDPHVVNGIDWNGPDTLCLNIVITHIHKGFTHSRVNIVDRCYKSWELLIGWIQEPSKILVQTSIHFPYKSGKVSVASVLFKVGKVAEQIKEGTDQQGHWHCVSLEGLNIFGKRQFMQWFSFCHWLVASCSIPRCLWFGLSLRFKESSNHIKCAWPGCAAVIYNSKATLVQYPLCCSGGFGKNT